MTITQQELICLFDLDAETGILINKIDRRRCAGAGGRVAKAGDRPGGANSSGYWQITVNGKSYLEHRLVWLFVKGRFPLCQIDHIDGNRLNNKIENLRECSQEENNQNTSKTKAKRTSRHLGVSFDSTRGKWCASLHFQGRHYMKFCESEHSALQERARLKNKYHNFNQSDREVV